MTKALRQIVVLVAITTHLALCGARPTIRRSGPPSGRNPWPRSRTPADGSLKDLHSPHRCRSQRQGLWTELFKARATDRCGYGLAQARPAYSWRRSWVRDGRKCRSLLDVAATRKSSIATNTLADRRFTAVDVAGFDQPGGIRFAAVWVERPPDEPAAKLYAGMPANEHDAAQKALAGEKLAPTSLHVFTTENRSFYFSGVWSKELAEHESWGFRWGTVAYIEAQTDRLAGRFAAIDLATFRVEQPTLADLADGHRHRVTADTSDWQAWHSLGSDEFLLGHDDAAVEAFSKVIAGSPGYLAGWSSAGRAMPTLAGLAVVPESDPRPR